jgi:phosphoglycolate phosphatase-like HAD superfamily hydrolase
LHLANVNIEVIPFASSDDAMARTEIIQHAIDRAAKHHGRGGFERIVYVGDGSWDAEAAQNLGIGFIGVVGDPAAKSFRNTDASFVHDFTNPVGFIGLLDSMSAPLTSEDRKNG